MKFYLVPENADFFSESFDGRIFDTREAADAFAQSVYLGTDINGVTSSWEVKQVPPQIDQWADRYERAAFLADNAETKYRIEQRDLSGNWSDDFTWNQGGNEFESTEEAEAGIDFILSQYTDISRNDLRVVEAA